MRLYLYIIFNAGLINFGLLLLYLMGYSFGASYHKNFIDFFMSPFILSLIALVSISFILLLVGTFLKVVLFKQAGSLGNNIFKASLTGSVFVPIYALFYLIILSLYGKANIEMWVFNLAIDIPIFLFHRWMAKPFLGISKFEKLKFSWGKIIAITILFLSLLIFGFFKLFTGDPPEIGIEFYPGFSINLTPEVSIYPSLSTSNKKIIYITNRNIYSLSIDGKVSQLLTKKSTTGPHSVIISHDGNMIAFSRPIPNQEFDYGDLFIMNGDGGNQQLIYKGEDDFLINPIAFLPDNKKIIFQRLKTLSRGEDEGKGSSHIMEMNIDGSNIRELLVTKDLIITSLSPDGKSLFAYTQADSYATDHAASQSIWRIDLSTLDREKIGEMNERPIYNVTVSPDSNKLLFQSFTGESSNKYSYQVFIADINGKNIKQITKEVDTVDNPIFTPDGSKILFVKEYKRKKSIMMMNPDGTDIRKIK